ncbi:MAG: hypothetical protein DDT35_01088 [Firmicutes bacterium]|nr:hypothetical protein [Bacillota bacterium]
MPHRWVDLSGGDRLQLKASLLTGSLSVYLVESGRERLKKAEILPSGQIAGKELKEHLAELAPIISMPPNAVVGEAQFMHNRQQVVVRNQLLGREGAKTFLHRVYLALGFGLTRVTVCRDGIEIFDWTG